MFSIVEVLMSGTVPEAKYLGSISFESGER